MVIGGIVAAVVIVGGTIAVLVRRRSHDDVHSVEHYHRQLLTLEEIRAHPSHPGGNGDGDGDGRDAYPSPAFKVGSSTVRLTDPNRPLVPPVPPPPVPSAAEPVRFDDDRGGLAVRPIVPGGTDAPADAGAESSGDVDAGAAGESAAGEEEKAAPAAAAASVGVLTSTGTPPATGMSPASAKGEERALHAIDHKPRRLAAPLAAIGAVTVLIVVLVIAGLHTNSKSPHHGTAATVTTTSAATHQTTTTTTAAPVVSAPSAATNHEATYQVTPASYSLALSATTGECWVEATNSSGAVLYTATLFAGQSHTVAATGPVTVIAGAPNAFSASVNGSSVTLPAGYQAPFTLKFVGASTTGGTGSGTGAPLG